MKTCCSCKEDKDESLFPYRNREAGVRQSYCKECKKLYNKKWYADAENKKNQLRRVAVNRKIYAEKVLKWKISYIQDREGCSYEGCSVVNPVMIDFDHVDPSTKFADVSLMMSRGYPIEKIEEEASKCQLLCANHHRLKTAEQVGWQMYLVSVSPPSPKGLKA